MLKVYRSSALLNLRRHRFLRRYHDESFGFCKPREFVLPDYTPTQLANRALNAPLLRYVDSLRTHGHLAGHIDPLNILQREEVVALDPARYGLTDDKKEYNIHGIIWTGSDENGGASEEWWTLGKITKHLRDVYIGNIGYEYTHSPSKTERFWFSRLLESPHRSQIPLDEEREKKHNIHSLLTRSETLEHFVQLKFPNLKRYGLEGSESTLPALDTLFNVASQDGIRHIVLVMTHRGRLNVITGLLQYSPTALFHKIKGGAEMPEDLGAEGDIMGHLFASPTLQYKGAANPIKISLLPNASPLEAINGIAQGKTRAKQFSSLKGASEEVQIGDRAMCVQLHGDASFAGQGVVMESLGLSGLPHFTSGGSVHIVVNNSIGFTTPASCARSSLYCSDIGKMIGAPILHVNGDHPEDVVKAMEIAFRYRHQFRKDVIIDLMTYRRWGHNEHDEPAYTQPLMYQNIRARTSVPRLYEAKLIAEQVLTQEAATDVRTTYKSYLEEQLSKVDSYTPHAFMLQDHWAGMVWPTSEDAIRNPDTGVAVDVLKGVGTASVKVPDGFDIHPRLHRYVTSRTQSMESGKGIDWATAEALAFGSLMLEGYDVRMSGQDIGRGTFSHRHATLVDQTSESVFVPLNAQLEAKGKLELVNSSLSEFGVVGFEYGVSWERPDLLPLWEAQFGDFANSAQVITDSYISSAETKWLRQSGIVLLLPHGLDGAGPDHSSCRYERFLQLTDDRYTYNAKERHANVNMHVVYPTTPAQYFHLLRRQMKRNFRKPLVVVGPKVLLRLSAAASTLSELEPGTHFSPIISDPTANKTEVKRIVLLTGKLYYDLAKERESRGLNDKVAFIRIEELSPFPFVHLREVLEQYPNAQEYIWLQEEPRNQGAYSHVQIRIEEVLSVMGIQKRLRYIGREGNAAPVTGIGKIYRRQQGALVEAAFEGLRGA